MSAAQIARCGVSVALLAVSASISLAIGPVPFTLQTLVLALLPVALGGRDAVTAVALYLLLGAVGLPVFSGFSGGLGVIAGPTGGYLWGFLVGEVAAALVLAAPGEKSGAREWAAALVMLLVTYAIGTAQLALVLGVTPVAALGTAVVPFVLPDAVKLFVGVRAGRAVRRALSLGEARTA